MSISLSMKNKLFPILTGIIGFASFFIPWIRQSTFRYLATGWNLMWGDFIILTPEGFFVPHPRFLIFAALVLICAWLVTSLAAYSKTGSQKIDMIRWTVFMEALTGLICLMCWMIRTSVPPIQTIRIGGWIAAGMCLFTIVLMVWSLLPLRPHTSGASTYG